MGCGFIIIILTLEMRKPRLSDPSQIIGFIGRRAGVQCTKELNICFMHMWDGTPAAYNHATEGAHARGLLHSKPSVLRSPC